MLNIKYAKIRWSKENYIPEKVYGFRTKSYKGTPKQIADTFLKENSELLRTVKVIKDFKYERTIKSLGASIVLYQQHYSGLAVHGAWIAVHIDKKNRVFMVKNGTVPVTKLEQAVSQKGLLGSKKIDTIARDEAIALGVEDSTLKKEKLLFVNRGRPMLAWKVKVGSKGLAASWILFINAKNGSIVEERNMLKQINGKGRVFRPNPIVTLNRDDLYDKADKEQEVFKKAYRTVTLRNLVQEGKLKGKYVDTTSTPNNVKKG